MQCVQPREVHIAAIHHVERTGFEAQHVQHVHVVQLAIADVDEGRDGAASRAPLQVIQTGVAVDARNPNVRRSALE